MSQVEVDKVIPQSGTTLTIGDSGDTIAIASGATLSGSISGITNLTITGDLTVDTDTLYVDSTNNRVGIGTASPGADLHISSTAPLIRLTDTNDSNVDHLINGSGSALVLSADANNELASSTLRFSVDGSEAMRIDSSGNLLVGKTSHNSGATAGIQLNQDQLFVTKDGLSSAYFNRLTSDGDIVQFRKDGTTVGKIGVAQSDRYYFAGNTYGLSIDNSGAYCMPSNSSGNENDNVLNLGTSNSRFKNLYLGGGLYVGGSADANKLDDYEEGTWTPTFTSGANTLTITGGTQNYKYIKIGKTCFISINIENATVSGTTSASDQRITLPFTAVSGIRQTTSNVSFNTTGGLRYTTPDWIYGVMESTIIQLYGSDNLGYNSQPGAPTTGSGTYFFLTATYETA